MSDTRTRILARADDPHELERLARHAERAQDWPTWWDAWSRARPVEVPQRCRRCAGKGDEHYIERGQGRMGYYYDGPEECSGCGSTGSVRVPWTPEGRLNLLAYVGDERARSALGHVTGLDGTLFRIEGGKGPWWSASDVWVLSDWLSGLVRCADALTLAAGAAAWVTLLEWEEGADPQGCPLGAQHETHPECIGPGHAPRRALEAFWAWWRERTPGVLEAWQRARVSAGVGIEMAWLPWTHPEACDTATQAAAALAGEDVVRAAIRERLTAWALG